MYRISKLFELNGVGHFLRGVPPDHPCSRQHGHNYTFVFVFESPTLNERGFVIDYRDLNDIRTWLDTRWDHQNLNDLPEFANLDPTAENIACYLFQVFKARYPELMSVEVRETPKTSAVYYESPAVANYRTK